MAKCFFITFALCCIYLYMLAFRRFLFLFVDFLVKDVALVGFHSSLTFLYLLFLKRFAAALFVFNFGIFMSSFSSFSLFLFTQKHNQALFLPPWPAYRLLRYQKASQRNHPGYDWLVVHVTHLTTTEPQGNLYFVTLLQELACCLRLRIHIVLVDVRREAHFLNLNYLLLLFGLFFFAGHLIPIFSVINNLANRRIGIRCDKHQIQLFFSRHTKSFLRIHNSDLLSLTSDQSDLSVADLTVDH